jgi:hypothetical protein
MHAENVCKAYSKLLYLLPLCTFSSSLELICKKAHFVSFSPHIVLVYNVTGMGGRETELQIFVGKRQLERLHGKIISEWIFEK